MIMRIGKSDPPAPASVSDPAGIVGHILDIDQTSVRLRDASVAFRDGIIAQFRHGSSEALESYLDFGASRVVMPAFLDPHAHTEVSSRALSTMVDCRVPKCKSVDDVLQALSDGIADIRGTDTWLRAQANLFFNQKLSDRRYPTRAELDSVSRAIPIAVHAGGHSTLLNTRAMELVDVLRFSRGAGAMGRAVVEVGRDGSPTGLVSEIDSFLPIVDPPGIDDEQVLVDGCGSLYTRYGVTVVGDISGSPAGTSLLARLADEGRIPQRLQMFICAPGTLPFADALEAKRVLGISSRRADIRGVKVFSDGGFSSRNAATLTAYRAPHALRPGSKGRLNLSRPQLSRLLRETSAAGLQLIVHANGERAQAAVVEVAAAQRTRLPVRVEHAGNLLTQRSAAADWRRAGIEPVPQPGFLYNFGDFFPTYLGPVASRGRFPFSYLSSQGFELAGSSDVYVGAEDRQTNPFFNIWCSMARTTFNGHCIETSEALDFSAAVRMHTINAARVLGLDNQYGSISVGKDADVIVLDRNPVGLSADSMLDIQVDFVYVAGRLVYARPGAEPPRVTAPATL